MEELKIKSVKNTLKYYLSVFDEYLSSTREQRTKCVPDDLFAAMEYSLDAGGKRLRPILCMAAAERCGCHVNDALPLALGFEMLHTATLIHDDLPCMDNDDMRRGKPSNHVVFGETMAVLAGDALMACSLEYPLVCIKNIQPAKLLNAMKIFSTAIGPRGVCGGQALDMNTTSAEGDSDYVRRIAALKTGALIKAAILSGAALGSDDDFKLNCYAQYGLHLGSAFQIVDDILDVTSTAEDLGKTPGKDAEQGKITHVTVYGMEKARKMAQEESAMAIKSISPILGGEDFLCELAEYLVYRSN